MKTNGSLLEIILALVVVGGLVAWVMFSDTQLHARVDTVHTECKENTDTIAQARLEIQHELAEQKSDIKVILKTLELLYPSKVERAKELNGTN